MTERHAPVVQISTDPPGCPSLDLQAFKSIKLSQFVRLILAIWLSGRKRSQPPQQALPFSTQSACEQPQHDVVSLGGEEISKTGGEEIVTDIQRVRLLKNFKEEIKTAFWHLSFHKPIVYT